MTKRPISIILSLKTGAHCWEADGNGANLRNLLLLFTTPLIRIWNLWLKFCTEQVHLLVYYGFFTEPFPKSFPKSSKNIRCNSCLRRWRVEVVDARNIPWKIPWSDYSDWSQGTWLASSWISQDWKQLSELNAINERYYLGLYIIGGSTSLSIYSVHQLSHIFLPIWFKIKTF